MGPVLRRARTAFGRTRAIAGTTRWSSRESHRLRRHNGRTRHDQPAPDGQRLPKTRQSARVRLRGAAFNRVALKRDRKYTVSAYLKADRPGVRAVIYCGEFDLGRRRLGTFAVTTDWKRYHFSFFTADFKKSGYYLTWVGLDPAASKASCGSTPCSWKRAT